jgi:hypothetical protein
LARIIDEGFKTTDTKEDMAALRSEMTAGFERIEHLLLAEQKREIEDLKTCMKAPRRRPRRLTVPREPRLLAPPPEDS